MIHTLATTLCSGLCALAQLKASALQGDPPPPENPSEVMTMIMGAILVIGILAIAFRPSKRDRLDG